MAEKWFTKRLSTDKDRGYVIATTMNTVLLFDKGEMTPCQFHTYVLMPSRVLGLNNNEYVAFVNGMFPKVTEVHSIKVYERRMAVIYWRLGKELDTFLDLLNNKMELAIKRVKELEAKSE